MQLMLDHWVPSGCIMFGDIFVVCFLNSGQIVNFPRIIEVADMSILGTFLSYEEKQDFHRSSTLARVSRTKRLGFQGFTVAYLQSLHRMHFMRG